MILTPCPYQATVHGIYDSYSHMHTQGHGGMDGLGFQYLGHVGIAEHGAPYGPMASSSSSSSSGGGGGEDAKTARKDSIYLWMNVLQNVGDVSGRTSTAVYTPTSMSSLCMLCASTIIIFTCFCLGTIWRRELPTWLPGESPLKSLKSRRGFGFSKWRQQP